MAYSKDVKSIAKAGSTLLKGDVTLTGGTNVTLTQSGQDISIASSGGAPTDATYITQTTNASLSAEQALASLSTGIMKVTTTTGVISSVLENTFVMYADTRFASGGFTRDTATASGDQSITGIGFTPKAIICFAAQDQSDEGSWGFNGSLDKNISFYGASTTLTVASTAIDDFESAVDYYRGTIAFDADGFTVTWTRTGSPTGTLTVQYLVFR